MGGEGWKRDTNLGEDLFLFGGDNLDLGGGIKDGGDALVPGGYGEGLQLIHRYCMSKDWARSENLGNRCPDSLSSAFPEAVCCKNATNDRLLVAYSRRLRGREPDTQPP